MNEFGTAIGKPNSVRLKSRNLRELRLETVQLEMENQDMEKRLQQLKFNMSREKQEREKLGGYYWKSGQTGTFNTPPEGMLQNKGSSFQKLSAGKVKIKLLKDHPEELPRPSVDHVIETGLNKKERPKLKGNICGQCEIKKAGLRCMECGEDYCVSCFAKFHQKGAMKLHRMIPIQMEVQTSVTTLNVVNEFKKQIYPELASERNKHKDEAVNKGPPIKKNFSTQLMNRKAEVLILDQENVGDVPVSSANEQNQSFLLNGTFDEDASAKSFQEVLMEWRNGKETNEPESEWKPHEAVPVSTGVFGAQADLSSKKPIQIIFSENSLSYMEKLLLKKHRRTPVEQIGTASLVTSSQLSLIDSNNLMDEEELCLTADEVEEHKYCISLFDDEQPHEQLHYNETVLSISEIEDNIKQQIEETDCYEVEEATEIVKDETSAYVNSTCSSSPSVEISTSLTEGSPEVSYDIPELHYTEGVPSYSLTTTNVKNSEEMLSALGGKTSGTNADLSSSQNGSTKKERRTRTSPRGPKQRNKTERKCSAKSENTRSALANISLLISGVNNLQEDKSLSSEDGVENNHPISTGSNNNCMDIGFTTKPSMALQEIAHMKNPDVKHYCGLDGFFTMGLDPAQLDPGTFTPCTTYRAKDTTLNYSTGSADWRPGSSLSEYADELLVSNVITSSQPRPSSSLSNKIIPKRLTSPRYYQTSAGNTPVSPRPILASRLTQSALAPKPNYTEARPMSRAALEISEIQSIDCTGKEDQDLENQADLSALKCLEDEFKILRNNEDEEMYALKIKEYAFKKEKGLELRKTAIPSRSWDAEGHTDEEEEILRDKQNVMSLP